MGPKAGTSVLTRDTQRRRQCGDRGRDWSDRVQAKDCPGLVAATTCLGTAWSREQACPRDLGLGAPELREDISVALSHLPRARCLRQPHATQRVGVLGCHPQPRHPRPPTSCPWLNLCLREGLPPESPISLSGGLRDTFPCLSQSQHAAQPATCSFSPDPPTPTSVNRPTAHPNLRCPLASRLSTLCFIPLWGCRNFFLFYFLVF